MQAACHFIQLHEARTDAFDSFAGIQKGADAALVALQNLRGVQKAGLDLLFTQFEQSFFRAGQNFVRRGEEVLPHFSETRDERIREFHEMNATPVIGLWEGGVLRVEDGRVQLDGAAARVFRRGQPPVDLEPGADLADLLY